MEVFQRQFVTARVRQGSALVMVIVLTVLLSLIGTLFMMMARIDEMSTSSIKADAELKAAVEAVVDRINEVLVEDVFGNGSSWLNGSGASEAWDYPGNYDIWLANLEPELVDVQVNSTTVDIDQIGFRHITDLYGIFPATFIPGEFDGVDPADPETDLISMRYLRATIIDPADAISEGYKADADGDGVADSRWVKIPDIFSEDGKQMYAAVRIIDNGGMINVNTAYRDPTDIRDSLDAWRGGDWDGSQLSHVNLEGIMADGDVTAGKDGRYIQYARFGYDIADTEQVGFLFPVEFDDYISDIDYEFDVSRRILSPLRSSWNYSPFDIGDELELRNRFFLTSPTVNRFGHKAIDGTDYIWQKTFDPGTGQTGVKIPYTSSANLPNWFAKATADPATGTCNRRHLSTTYNFEKLARPYSAMTYPVSMTTGITPISHTRKFGITLPPDIQSDIAGTIAEDYYRQSLAMALYRGLPVDAVIDARFGIGAYTREELAWQMAVNMVDYQDANSLGEDVTKITIGNDTYFGVEDFETLNRDTLCISKLGYVRVVNPRLRQYVDPEPPIGDYFAVEVFNPDDDVKDLTDYEIRIVDGSDQLIATYTPLSGSLQASTSSGNTSVFVFANAAGASFDQLKSALGMMFLVNLGGAHVDADVSGIATGHKVIVVKLSTGMPVDCVSIPSGLVAGNDAIIKKYRSQVMPGTDILLPKWSSALDTDIWTDVAGVWRLGNDIDASPFPSASRMLVNPTDPNLAGLEKVQLDVPNEQLRNVGEIENVLAVGARYYENASTHTCNTVIGGIVDSVMTIKNNGADLTADQEEGIEMGSFGRIRLDDPDYWPMLDSFTYFDPARDGVYLDNTAVVPTVAPPGAIIVGTEDTLVDDIFFPNGSPWNAGTVNWTDSTTVLVINLGTKKDVFGAIIQADGNDEYALEYWYYDPDPTPVDDSGWYVLWGLDNYGIPGMRTRPDYQDDDLWHLFDYPVNTDLFMISTSSTLPTGEFSLSEIKLAVEFNSTDDDPHYENTIPGRININTAPWYVIDQLPWLETYVPSAADYGKMAQAIVTFRDRNAITGGPDYTGIPGSGFYDIAQLMQVVNSDPALEDYDIRKYMFDEDLFGNPINTGLPDYSSDNSTDNFEERNLLFHRISNLVTVRSDVFTAYILVRIGENGPQRRMIAIFDRSGIDSPSDKPKLVALHRVPDPR
ncbi:MAG: hypothetical protein FVQ79_11800 [Planctomycetes bacterium]|nr:hypothetical protein [Planctomycetota bacterium]